jgi:hypothetical protein
MTIGEYFIGTHQRMAYTGPGIVLQNGIGYGNIPVDIAVFIAMAGIGV